MAAVMTRLSEKTIEEAIDDVARDLQRRGIEFAEDGHERLVQMAKDAFLRMAESRDLDPESDVRDQRLIHASINLGRLIALWTDMDSKRAHEGRVTLTGASFKSAYDAICPCYPCG